MFLLNVLFSDLPAVTCIIIIMAIDLMIKRESFELFKPFHLKNIYIVGLRISWCHFKAFQLALEFLREFTQLYLVFFRKLHIRKWNFRYFLLVLFLTSIVVRPMITIIVCHRSIIVWMKIIIKYIRIVLLIFIWWCWHLVSLASSFYLYFWCTCFWFHDWVWGCRRHTERRCTCFWFYDWVWGCRLHTERDILFHIRLFLILIYWIYTYEASIALSFFVFSQLLSFKISFRPHSPSSPINIFFTFVIWLHNLVHTRCDWMISLITFSLISIL